MRGYKWYMLVLGLLLVLYMVVLYNRPAPVDWRGTYARTDKIPYGTYVLFNRLGDIFKGIDLHPSARPVYNTLDTMGSGSGAYVVVTPRLKLGDPDFRVLKNYLVRGNDVLIATFDLGEVLRDSLGLEVSGSYLMPTVEADTLHFLNPVLWPGRAFVMDKQVSSREFSRFDTAKTVLLGKKANGKANFIRMDIGRGHLYVLPSPDFFSNYAMLQPDGAVYAATVLSHLDPKGTLIWDDYQTAPEQANRSPVRVFLQDGNLRPAYYLALFSLLLFVGYEVKRRQRIIPPVEPLANASMEFVRVVSSVYYQQHNNKDILDKQILYFLEQVRAAYRFKTRELDAGFEDKLIQRSGVDERTVRRIFRVIRMAKDSTYSTDSELLAFNREMEKFYEQSGITWKNNSLNNEQI